VLKKRLPVFRWICKQLQSKIEATPRIFENARQERSRLLDELHEEQQSDELLKELIATNESVEKATATRSVAKTELIILREVASKSSVAEAELEKVSAELNVLKEAKAKLAESIA
jgi:hypothetical protein